MMSRRRRRALLAMAIGVACVVALAARIWSVNATAVSIPVESYSVGDAVALEGAFSEYKYENTDGYSVSVTAARRMSINEYLAAYSADQDAADEYLSNDLNKTDYDAKTLLVLDIEMTNDKTVDDERGYLDSIGWSIKNAEHPELWIRTESSLLNCSIPQAEGTFKLSIKSGTSYVLHVPFAIPRMNDPFPAGQYDSSLPETEAGDYEFVVTKAPVRKVIHFSVE